MAEIKELERDDVRLWPRYTISETAGYLGLPRSTLQSWVRPTTGSKALVSSGTHPGYNLSIPFIGFAEAFVLAAARRAGLRKSRIREGVAAVRRQLGVEHALATKRLYVDRAELLVAPPGYVGETGVEMEVARNQQIQITDVVWQDLQLITYGGDGYATSLVLPVFGKIRVIVDPAEAFGAPIISRTGTRVKDVLSQFWAGEAIGDIAYDFDLTPAEVEDVIRAQTKPAS